MFFRDGRTSHLALCALLFSILPFGVAARAQGSHLFALYISASVGCDVGPMGDAKRKDTTEYIIYITVYGMHDLPDEHVEHNTWRLVCEGCGAVDAELTQ